MMILTVPMVSALEHAICARHYHDNIPTSELCKAPVIQRKLSEIRGWAASFETFSVTNSVLPIKLVWASSVFLLVGGGRYAAEMLLAAMVAKACTEETRTRGLYYFYSCFIFSELVGPPVASVAADISPWLPFLISYLLLFFTFPLLLVMPKDYIAPSSATINSAEDLPASYDQGHGILRAALHALFDQIHLLRFMLSSHNMCLAAVVFLISTFRGISLRALVQYASSRFDWKLSRTNALIGEVALVNLILFFFIMPALLRIVSKYLKSTPQVLNLGIVRASLSLLFLGSLLLGFATNSAFLIAATMIYGLGFGARSTLLSLVTSWIDPQRAGTLFSAVFLIEQIGMLGGEPLVQNVLGISLGLEDPWKGLPFICTAVRLEPLKAFDDLTNDQGILFNWHRLHVFDENTT
ncbi:uncharacterized protein FMAN_02256 [Fusarium mangiferae]|uniref:Major facilitator superfamily (MFS) profile domain-containing protein n=1 Tax=Fusarium mangiferae TaxID=192010 RepID=A0A1L7TLE4_FUSMA|nr:uncharacterized protein FMAN_02256 [Fusarium mangiferae]CVK99414.1 uncharacterized protein FMAN_02256 [Fusarium mangiferae]